MLLGCRDSSPRCLDLSPNNLFTARRQLNGAAMAPVEDLVDISTPAPSIELVIAHLKK
jgi:hypothetical protein